MKYALLILGAGQYSAVVKEIAQETGQYEKIAFLDDRFSIDQKNQLVQPAGVIGKMDDLEHLAGTYTHAIPAIGNPEIRMKLIDRIKKTHLILPTLVSQAAYVAPSAQLEKGCVIEPMAVVHANTRIGEGTYVSAGAVVNHNAVVCDGCHIDNNAVVMSGVHIQSYTKIHAGYVVSNAKE